MGRVILASQNKDKIREIDTIFRKYDMPVISRDEAGLPKDEIEETGQTFEENSLIKALGLRAMIEADESLSEHLDSIIVADDTGLMVDALNGAPGVYSARYAGEDCRYEDNCRKLIEELKDVPYEERTAHFETVITLLYPDGTKLVAVGQCKGHIGTEPKGDAGFGYDPLFIPEGYDKTFAELGTDIKNTISHRANALAELESLLG